MRVRECVSEVESVREGVMYFSKFYEKYLSSMLDIFRQIFPIFRTYILPKIYRNNFQSF